METHIGQQRPTGEEDAMHGMYIWWRQVAEGVSIGSE